MADVALVELYDLAGSLAVARFLPPNRVSNLWAAFAAEASRTLGHL